MSRELTFEGGILNHPREIKSGYMMRKLSIVVRSNRVNSSDVEMPDASLARDPGIKELNDCPLCGFLIQTLMTEVAVIIVVVPSSVWL
jgi:hypothetical protein